MQSIYEQVKSFPAKLALMATELKEKLGTLEGTAETSALRDIQNYQSHLDKLKRAARDASKNFLAKPALRAMLKVNSAEASAMRWVAKVNDRAAMRNVAAAAKARDQADGLDEIRTNLSRLLFELHPEPHHRVSPVTIEDEQGEEPFESSDESF
jgi:hypothetical protein